MHVIFVISAYVYSKTCGFSDYLVHLLSYDYSICGI